MDINKEAEYREDLKNISNEVRDALSTHQHICECGQTAATMIVEIGKSLKKMRDGKLYIAMGFSSFAEYVEKNGDFAFKERQAYTYIRLFEDNSTKFLEDNANLGITKLDLLSKLPGYERQEFVEENNIAGMTVDEVKALIKEHQQQGEQLSMFEAEAEKNTAEKSDLEKQVAELKEKLTAAESKPAEVTVRELTAEELEAIKSEAKEKLKKEYDKKLNVEVKKAESKSLDSVKEATAKAEEFEAKLIVKNREANEKEARIRQLEAQLAAENKSKKDLEAKIKSGNSDEAIIALKIIFADTQKNITSFVDKIKAITDTQKRAQFINSTVKWLKIIIDELEGESDA